MHHFPWLHKLHVQQSHQWLSSAANFQFAYPCHRSAMFINIYPLIPVVVLPTSLFVDEWWWWCPTNKNVERRAWLLIRKAHTQTHAANYCPPGVKGCDDFSTSMCSQVQYTLYRETAAASKTLCCSNSWSVNRYRLFPSSSNASLHWLCKYCGQATLAAQILMKRSSLHSVEEQHRADADPFKYRLAKVN